MPGSLLRCHGEYPYLLKPAFLASSSTGFQGWGAELAILEPARPHHRQSRKMPRVIPAMQMLGATKERSEVWKWVDGSALTFQPWERGQPNDLKGRENFLAMGPKGTWYDVAESDDWTQGYICEWKAK